MKILVINGPNLNMLGIREPEIYGRKTYEELVAMIENYTRENGIDCEIFQSNHEGDIIDKIQSAYRKFDGIVINPAGFTHTSVAIADALASVDIPAIEVHISDTNAREDFRRVSFVRTICKNTVQGMGFEGYIRAIEELAVGNSK